jgi:hypothetical protein
MNLFLALPPILGLVLRLVLALRLVLGLALKLVRALVTEAISGVLFLKRHVERCVML